MVTTRASGVAACRSGGDACAPAGARVGHARTNSETDSTRRSHHPPTAAFVVRGRGGFPWVGIMVSLVVMARGE